MLCHFLIRFLLFAMFLIPCPVVAKEDTPIIWNISRQEIDFIGRHKELNEIQSKYAETPIVAIVGLAGIGKTSLAKQYAINNAGKYKVVWFIDMRRDVESQFYELALELCRNKIIKEKVLPHQLSKGVNVALQWLRTTTDSWLLIFDNLEQRQELAKYLPETYKSKKKNILITTRYAQDRNNALQLLGFSDSESISFCQTGLGKKYPVEDLSKLTETLGHHPRAMLHALALISRVPGMTCDKYIERFNKDVGQLSQEEKMILAKHESNEAFHTSLEMIIKEIEKESPESLEFLTILASLSASHIEEEILCKAQDILNFDGKKTYLYLLKPSLLQKEDSGYSIHPYVQKVILSYMRKEHVLKAQEKAIKVISSFLDEGIEGAVKVFEKNPNLLNHIVAITEYYKGNSKLATDIEVSALYYLYYYQRRYEFCLPIIERCKERIEKRGNDIYSLSVGRFYSLYSFFAYAEGTLKDAINAELKAKTILEQLNDETAKHELVMLLTNNLAAHYNAQGDNVNALKCVEEAAQILGSDSNIMNELTILYVKILCAIDEGDFDSAREFIKQQFDKLKDDEFAKFVLHVTNLLAAKVEMKTSNIEGAKKYSETAYQYAMSCTGNDETHETVARVAIVLAISELEGGNLNRAEQLTEKAIRSFVDTYKSTKKNRQLAYAYMVNGDIALKRNDLDKALQHYQLALETYSYELTNLNIDDVSELYLRLVELGLLMHEKLLWKDYMDKHIEIFGISHPRSIEILKMAKAAA